MDQLEADFHLMSVTSLRSKAYKKLTRQEEKYVLSLLRGATTKQAREAAGLKPGPPLETQKEHVFDAIQMFREQDREACHIDRQKITVMLLESHAKASEVKDEINAAVHLGKLHGVFESDKQKGTKVDIKVTNNRLEVMSDDELLRQSNLKVINLEPERLEHAE